MSLVTLSWFLDGPDWETQEWSGKIQSAGTYREMLDSRDQLVTLLEADGWDVTLTNRKRNITATKDGETKTYRIDKVQTHSSILAL